MSSGGPFGIEFAGSGVCLPKKVVTNRDLESVMDTTDEWISKRTGIRQRHSADPELGETNRSLALGAAKAALDHAGVRGSDVDLVITATMTPDMPTPSTAPLLADELGTANATAFDVSAACSGFVFSLNVASSLMSTIGYSNVLLVGVDLLSRYVEFSTRGRSTAVLFGDAAGAVVLRRSGDANKKLLAQIMGSDGGGARHLYIPCHLNNMLGDEDPGELPLHILRMNGQAVFRFAVSKFPQLIADTLDQAGLEASDIDHYVCHQSNARILEASRQRFDIPESKLRVNIDRFGNTVAASVPLVFNELVTDGLVQPGQKVMFLGFGAGLTWGSSLWQF